jgi:hypothetical protein
MKIPGPLIIGFAAGVVCFVAAALLRWQPLATVGAVLLMHCSMGMIFKHRFFSQRTGRSGATDPASAKR